MAKPSKTATRRRRVKHTAKVHYGTVTRLGFRELVPNARSVVIDWDEDGSTTTFGISDSHWEIFKLAFQGSGRIAVHSDREESWQFDFRFLEALRS